VLFHIGNGLVSGIQVGAVIFRFPFLLFSLLQSQHRLRQLFLHSISASPGKPRDHDRSKENKKGDDDDDSIDG